MSNLTIALSAVIVLVIAVVAWIVLLRRYAGGNADPRVELDAIRTAGTLVVGTGGAVALLLAARRQRFTELTLVHTERDATERRITELYTKAADQLGSDQPPARLAGLYALERLAQNTVEHRQTIVDVICTYLRMPYTPRPPEVAQVATRHLASPRRRQRRTLINDRRSPSEATAAAQQQQSRQERQVRLAAQAILTRNLRLPNEKPHRWWNLWRQIPPEPPWPGIRLDLSGALLLDFDLMGCQIAEGWFTGARFIGMAFFSEAQFNGPAFFDDAQFAAAVEFDGAQFTDLAFFNDAQFAHEADFVNTEFTGFALFGGVKFTGTADFTDTQFAGETEFNGVQFNGNVDFNHAQFDGKLDFNHAHFNDEVNFAGAQFIENVDFNDASARGPAMETVWPPGWTMRPVQPSDEREDPAARYLVRSEHPVSEEK